MVVYIEEENKNQQTFADFSEIQDPNHYPQISCKVDKIQALKDFDYIFMRKDPPVDEDYMNALHLLSQAETEGANIVNRPAALKKFNEKIFALQYSKWMPDTSVICKAKDFELFKNKHSIIILKPLDGMGGESIYKFDETSEDHQDIFQSLTNNYQSFSVGDERNIIDLSNQSFLLINPLHLFYCNSLNLVPKR